LKTGFI